MADNLINSNKILNETLRIVHNQSAYLGNINRQYDDKFAQMGAKVGAIASARLPVQYTIRNGAVANIQDVNETTVPITIQPEFGIDWDFTDYDLTLNIDKFSERYLEPAGKRIAAEIDTRIGLLYKKVANFSGTPGTVPSTPLAALDAAVLLDNNIAPRDGNRTFALTPLANSRMVNGMGNLFNDSGRNSKQMREGLMTTNLGMDFQMSQNLPSHTVGPLGGTPLVNGANQGIINVGTTDNPHASGGTLVTDGWTAAAALRLNEGDVITISGVGMVNPETKAVTGDLMRFVVTANVSSDGAGNATIPIFPAIIAGGAYQNVTARPADNAAITVVSGAANTTYAQNMLYHKDAFTMVTVDMEKISGMDMFARSSADGVSMRFVRGYDIVNNRRICRFDILAGFSVLRPQWACRVPQ
jgi:P22 coat protein - gene protein 5